MRSTGIKRHCQYACILLVTVFSMQVMAVTPDPPAVSILNQMIAKGGYSRNALTVPEPWESGYITSGRLPAVVDTLVNPFYIAPFAQVFGARFSGIRGAVSPDQLLENAFEMMSINTTAYPPFKSKPMSLLDALENLQTTHHRGLIEPEYRLYLEQQIAVWPVELEEAMSVLVQAMTQASLLRSQALALLTPDEIRSLSDTILTIVSEDAFANGHLFLTGVDDRWSGVLKTFASIDFSRLSQAASIMTDAIELTRVRLHEATLKIPVIQEQLLLDFRSAIGQIVVAGTGVNYHVFDAALLVDLGGNDIYQNNAGGYIGPAAGICCLLDLSGNDTYDSSRPGSIGGAILGVSMCLDYDGHDTYRSGAVSQGAAIGGVGLFYDENGHDTYTAGVFCQGAAAFGIGLAADVSGDDVFICQSIGQGFGTTLGLGILVDVAGDDTYFAGPKMAGPIPVEKSAAVFAQGSGSGFRSPDKTNQISYYGGIGLLIDGKGHDHFIAGNFCQGAAQFASVGILFNGSGDDTYKAGNFSQGTAMDWGSAAIIDQQGNDVYIAEDTSQGAAVNHSNGFLLDYDGDDSYTLSAHHGQGHARESCSMGLFIDYRGFDRYHASPFVRGSTINMFRSTDHILGLFIDHRGRDVYMGARPDATDVPGANNSEWGRNSGEAGIDTTLSPSLYFASEHALSRHQHYDMNPVSDLESDSGLSRLGSGDPFLCFHAVGQVIRKGKDVIPVIIHSMQRGHDSFRRTMEEGLGQIMIDSFGPGNSTAILQPMLSNLDPKSRQWCLVQMSMDRNVAIADTIATAINDTEAPVRKTAIDIIGTMAPAVYEAELIQIAIQDIDPACRLSALNALSRIAGEHNHAVFRSALTDRDVTVHYAARRHITAINDTASIGSLQLLTGSNNTHIRLSAGTALIELGEKSGFPIAIDLLDQVNQVRSNHDPTQLLADFLAEYSGRNYGWDKASWRLWWVENEAVFSLGKAMAARKDYLSLLNNVFNLTPLRLIRTLDQLRQNHPDYHGLDRKLAPYIRAAAQLALSSKSMKQTQKLIDYAIEMNPAEAETWVLLSRFHRAGNQWKKAIEAMEQALTIEPNNPDYKKMLTVYQRGESSGS